MSLPASVFFSSTMSLLDDATHRLHDVRYTYEIVVVSKLRHDHTASFRPLFLTSMVKPILERMGPELSPPAFACGGST